MVCDGTHHETGTLSLDIPQNIIIIIIIIIITAMAPTIVLITGANRGLGKALAERYLARDDHTVVAAVRDPDHPTSKTLADLPAGRNSRLVVVKIDSTAEADALEAVGSLSSRGIDRLDLVIANAGVAQTFPRVSELKVADLQRHIEPNVFGVVWLFQAALPLLRRSDKPKWITVGSSAGQLEVRLPRSCVTNLPGEGWGRGCEMLVTRC